MISNQTYASKPQNTAVSLIIGVLFFAGLCSLFLSMDLYDVVAMPLSTALLLWIAPGIVTAPLLLRQASFSKIKSTVGKLFALTCINILGIGSLVLYTVLAVDFYKSPGTPVSIVKYVIVDAGGLGKKDRPVPFADINYKNGHKRFTFSVDSVSPTTIL
ncbi:MAG: hypothetical protein JO080_00820, partial [Mucilaginibacter sp.]|nr:hypothetical protein [Mucilaginibacter sp.]